MNFFFENIEPLAIEDQVKTWLNSHVTAEGRKPGDINFIFCDDEYLLTINREYLQHDYYTDIITFDYVHGKIISGDIFISLQRISDNAETHDNTYENEFRRVLAHGLLHLCGYKDKTAEETAVMRTKEDFYLSRF